MRKKKQLNVGKSVKVSQRVYDWLEILMPLEIRLRGQILEMAMLDYVRNNYPHLLDSPKKELKES